MFRKRHYKVIAELFKIARHKKYPSINGVIALFETYFRHDSKEFDPVKFQKGVYDGEDR